MAGTKLSLQLKLLKEEIQVSRVFAVLCKRISKTHQAGIVHIFNEKVGHLMSGV